MNAANDAPFVHDLSPAQLRAWQENSARQAGLSLFFQDAMQDGNPGPELAIIPAGVFTLGNAEAERGFGELAPRHVAIERAFAIGRYCVTADEFQRYADSTGHLWPDHLVRTEARQPVTNVSRLDAAAYLAWLAEQSGHTYRLPSEAEWEYAARAGSASRYCFGDDLGCSEANTGSFQVVGRSVAGWRRFLPFCAPMQQAIDVGLYPANLWGLHDMHGNVWEFTSDLWEGQADPNSPGKTGKWYVTKGGSWFESAWQARSCARKPRWFDELDVNLGFRVVRGI
ncbi:MAG: SUMF1/EgtB/PvdO family nonheme iron enzyme [Pseudomonadota bacterium]|nr:SUMF1/EgtB/PvdO family nonheme iron enzyme [Pseudomonadota bacterium]